MNKISPTAIKYVENLNLTDLKRGCVSRGLEFQEVGNKSILNLQSWYLRNFDNPIDEGLLEKFDIWCEELLSARGNDGPMLSSTFRLSAVAERDAEGKITKRKRIKRLGGKIRKKKARTSEGLFQGTKKAYTYELVKQGKTKAEAILEVIDKFPDAKEKSIGIWYNRAKKAGDGK